MLGFSTATVRAAIKDLIIDNLIWGILIALLGSVGSYFISKSVSNPLIKLANATKHVSSGNWDFNISITSKDEIGLLSKSVIKMLKNLKIAEEKQKNYNKNLERTVKTRTKELEKVIFDLKTAQTNLVQSEKLASIGQLAAGIAHEINTPAQYVGDNTRFLKDSFDDISNLFNLYTRLINEANTGSVLPELTAGVEEAAREADVEYLSEEIPRAIDQSLDGIKRISEIVQAMKEFSHPDAKEKASIDINRAIKSTITVSRNEWKYVAEIKTDFDQGLPLIPCLAGEFNQVILNIIINAAHAIKDVIGDSSNGKGTITISTRHVDSRAEIRISDTGAGIPEENRNRIFDPFFTTKDVGKGTGQGLAISHNVIVDKHGGTISFETEMDKGTTFIIELPVSSD